MGMRSLRGLVVVAGLLLVTVGLACADKGTMRDQLIAALARPDSGLRALLRSPVAAAEAKVGDRYEEALALLPELVKSHPSPRVRLGALRLWPRVANANYVRQHGHGSNVEDEVDFINAAMAASQDPSADVRVGALILLCESYGPGFHPRVRSHFAGVRGDLEARRSWSGAAKALEVLGGSSDVVKRLLAAVAAPRLPGELEEDLKQLRREPTPEAAPPLAALFPRLPAIAKRQTPTHTTMAGIGTLYDADSRLARDVAVAWAECSPAADAPKALAFLKLATPEMMHVIFLELTRLPTGLAITAAIAGSSDFSRSVREEAIDRVALMAGDRSDFERAARDALIALGKSPEIGDHARAALAEARRSRPGFSR